MSYILDALKKSEEERELVRMLRTTGTTPGFFSAGRRRLWPAMLGLLVLVLGGFVALRYLGPPAPVAQHTLPNLSQPATAVPADALAPRVTPETPVPTSEPAARALAPKPPVDDLAAQTRVARVDPAAAEPKPVIAPKEPPRQSAPTRPEDPGTILFLRQMPEDFQRRVPGLAVNIHLYSANESENVVYINDRQYRRGEEVTPGVRLEQIVPEGVVLSYEGKRFKVPRPN